jgi:AraC family transcriptional regulator of adaptative response / DNA-3-methyladenine glycosylase II
VTLPITPIAAWHRAVDRRDRRFDGVFFVGIRSTRIYCRPICPSRLAKAENRLFFSTALAAERAGFRACLRCRPDLAPGKAPVDAVARLARAVARRIADGALNAGSISALAKEFGVSPRHVRRAVEREFGVPPSELAQAHRLQSAERLIVETSTPVIQVAYASGFQSLRRFNAAFRACYRASPTAVRRCKKWRTVSAMGMPTQTTRIPAPIIAPFTENGRGPIAESGTTTRSMNK